MTTPFAPVSPEDQALINRHGIQLVLVPRYDVDGFRYSTLKDAVAQARRGQKP